jgi:hypothetical protein
MRKFLISSALVVGTLGLAACSDNVDENATGSVNDDPMATEQPAAPAGDPAATTEPAAPAPAPAN